MRLRIAWILAITLLAAAAAKAQTTATPEEVEAAYIYKFIGYVDWPAASFGSPNAPIIVGVRGSQPIYELLTAIASDHPVRGRRVEVRRLTTPVESGDVNLIFVGRGTWKELEAWTAAAGRHVLVVTDADQGVERGAALAFVQRDQRIRFEASLPAAERAGVRLSGRLLAVAERVIGTAP